MRCLYCGKELALLKRLRGGGDFCSDAHKQSYQEEYNRLALSRLLQAQKKGQQATNAPAQSTAPPPNASVALEEPVPAGVLEDDATEETSNAPELEIVPEAALDSGADDLPGGDTIDESPVDAEPEPAEAAGFLFESLAMAGLADATLYLEPWLELSPGPAMSEWQAQNGALSLTSADLLSLDLRPQASSIEDHAVAADLSPQAFTGAQPDPTLSTPANAKQIPNADLFPAGGVMAIDIEPSAAVASIADPGLAHALGLESTALFEDSELLELPPTAIDFPTEDADVVVLVRIRNDKAEPVAPGEEADTEEAPTEDNGPRASLEALSRLHQELVEQEAVHEVAAPAEVVEATPQATPEIVELAAEEPKPKFISELFEFSLKTFPPAKAALIGGDAFPSNIAPLVPHLKVLPLRPKVALASGYVPPTQAAVVAEPPPAAPVPVVPVRTQATPKPAAAGKPAARLTQPKQPSQAGKAGQAAAKAPEPRTAVAPKPVSPKADATKAVAKPVASESVAVQEVVPKPPPAEKEQTPKPAAAPPKPAAEKAKPAAETKKDNAPNFGIAQPAKASGFGSLKVKLGIAIVLLVIACVYFLGWGGAKSPKASISNAAVSADGSGPSIIMGEGGWVENWAGDPNGLHAGRQITIYRPSLKLSDYRLEFQASIDTKSVGWVFRAADPDNYYAMKLMTVSAGLSPKVALFKYLVVNGRQTQVGRVPIDLAVQQDTAFDVRVDVRGPKFTTYLQGQQVDSWTDDQLKTGGAGFLNEREERGKVKAVSIRYLSGGPK
jgi:hypothetical protein